RAGRRLALRSGVGRSVRGGGRIRPVLLPRSRARRPRRRRARRLSRRRPGHRGRAPRRRGPDLHLPFGLQLPHQPRADRRDRHLRDVHAGTVPPRLGCARPRGERAQPSRSAGRRRRLRRDPDRRDPRSPHRLLQASGGHRGARRAPGAHPVRVADRSPPARRRRAGGAGGGPGPRRGDGAGASRKRHAAGGVVKATGRLRRGAYLIPSLFTTGNLLCGYIAVMRSLKGDYEWAAVAIFVAALLDRLDGWVARLTGTSSDFGVQLDSIADIISFGMAPALVAYLWGLAQLPKPWSLAPFLYLAAGATRLARFNIQTAVQDRRFFIGLPIPAGACVLAACVFYSPARLVDPFTSILVSLLVVVLGVLMVSHLRYRSF